MLLFFAIAAVIGIVAGMTGTREGWSYAKTAVVCLVTLAIVVAILVTLGLGS